MREAAGFFQAAGAVMLVIGALCLVPDFIRAASRWRRFWKAL